jgi:hypothetical protein
MERHRRAASATDVPWAGAGRARPPPWLGCGCRRLRCAAAVRRPHDARSGHASERRNAAAARDAGAPVTERVGHARGRAEHTVWTHRRALCLGGGCGVRGRRAYPRGFPLFRRGRRGRNAPRGERSRKGWTSSRALLECAPPVPPQPVRGTGVPPRLTEGHFPAVLTAIRGPSPQGAAPSSYEEAGPRVRRRGLGPRMQRRTSSCRPRRWRDLRGFLRVRPE